MNPYTFINSIHINSALWDRKHKLYNNRDYTKKIWNDISEELNIPYLFAKTKWRGLRDTFRREYHKSTKDETYTSTWKYYAKLNFLLDQMTPNANQDDNDSISQQDISLDEKLANAIFIAAPDESCSRDSAGIDEEYIQDIKLEEKCTSSKRKTEFNDEMSERELKKLRMAPDSATREDSDYHFLMSLLPFMRNVDFDRKLLVRNKLQQVLLEEDELSRQNNFIDCQ